MHASSRKVFWQWDDLSAALVKSGPLDFPSEKKFSFNFAHEKGLVGLEFSFFVSPQAKNDFWPDHPCGQLSKV